MSKTNNTSVVSTVISPEVKKTPEQIQEEIKALQAQVKALKAETKAPKQLKGVKVKFKTQNGTEITGLGVLYYVTRFEGKLYYKEASAVEVLPTEEVKA